MRLVALASAAALAVSITAPVFAQQTNYSVSGDHASGTFSLNYDGSNYSLSTLDLRVGTWFTTANAGFGTSINVYQIGGNAGANGPLTIVDTEPDFAIGFDPTLATQTGTVTYPVGGLNFAPVTITQTGTVGSTTSYSVSGDPISGTFLLDFDGSNYSLSALDLFLGTEYTTANAGFGTSINVYQIGGDAGANGPLTLVDTEPDFAIGFDPAASSQAATLAFPQGGLQFSTVNITQVIPGVPEPSSWAMMLLGFAGVGTAMRGRRKAALAQLA